MESRTDRRKFPLSHETLYQHVYADNHQGGNLWQHLRCQKKKRKRYASGRDRRGQIKGRRPISERPAHIEARKQIGHWEGDTVIGAHHKQAIVTQVERKSGYAVMAKVSNKTAELVSAAIVTQLKPLMNRVSTLTFDNGKEFAPHAQSIRSLAARPISLTPTPVGNEGRMKTSMACCANTFPRSALCIPLPTRNL